MHTPHLNHVALIQCPRLNQALMDRGLITTWIHQSPISTPLIPTAFWYMPAWSGAACGASGTRISVPTSITGHRSIKCPGSLQRQQAGPDVPAALVAGSGSRDGRGESGGKWTDGLLWLASPASLGMDLSPADSGAGPPLHWGWARGGRFTLRPRERDRIGGRRRGGRER